MLAKLKIDFFNKKRIKVLVTLRTLQLQSWAFVVNIGKEDENFVDFANSGCESGGFLR